MKMIVCRTTITTLLMTELPPLAGIPGLILNLLGSRLRRSCQRRFVLVLVPACHVFVSFDYDCD